MRPDTKLLLFTSLAFAAGVGVTVGLQAIYHDGGFLKDSVDLAFRPPITPTKVLIVITAALVFAMLPVGIAEWRSERAYVRAEQEMRAARPGDAVTRYEGPEGRGFLFDGPAGRTLLLEPAGGIGQPRTLELPPIPELPAELPAPAANGDSGGAPAPLGELP